MLSCKAVIQSHFNYVCAAWYPNLNKKYKNKLQVLQVHMFLLTIGQQ